MNPGDLLIQVALFATIGSGLLYAFLGRRPRIASVANGLFLAQSAALVLALGFLWRLFLVHDFGYAYVAQYSSRALSPALTLAASWAGQEGSILLWAAIGAVLGLALMRQPGGLARPALAFVCLNQVFLILLLLVRSPFTRTQVIPTDGRGLNPLLEDPWMVAHPPLLFVGYAAMMIPFALTAAALLRSDRRDWNRAVWPWTLFAVVSLGGGIVLGGIWAYKTLGWGGYWGWDPVENASLIPWLLAVALLHGLLIQRTKGAVTRTSFLLALLGWISVIGGTYLTRSGILQDFSVHSFADAGLNAPLVTFLAVATALGAGLLAWRWRSIPRGEANWLGVSRESALWMGLVTVVVLAVLVAFGTAAPLITGLAGSPASVQTGFYNTVSKPLGIVLLLLVAVAPALRWSRQQGHGWVLTLWPGFAAGLIAVLSALVGGMAKPGELTLVFTSGLALGVNAVIMVRLFARGWSYGAGYLGHVGLAVAVLGMVISSTLGRSEKVRLAAGEPVSALGYTLTFRGEEPDLAGQHRLIVQVQGRGIDVTAHPRLFKPAQMDGMMRKPAMLRNAELYLSPLEVTHEAESAEPTWLAKDQPFEANGTRYTFTGFRMTSHDDLVVHADVRVERDGQTHTIAPGVKAGPSGSENIDAELAGVGRIGVARIDADRQRVALTLPGVAAPVAMVELSTKPLINLVWIGALLTLLGTSLAGVRRAIEKAPARSRAGAAPASVPLRGAVAER